MTIRREKTKQHFLMGDSLPAYKDLTGYQYCMVAITGAAANAGATITSPTGQGAIVYGVLQLEVTAAGDMCELLVRGIAEIKAYEAFNAGSELTVFDATGRVEAAASGDYVCAIAREASGGENHLISATLCGYYKP